jgi:hypothetical protein
VVVALVAIVGGSVLFHRRNPLPAQVAAAANTSV